MKVTELRPKLVVAGGGRGVVGHAGARLLADLAEATGLQRVQLRAGADAAAGRRVTTRAGSRWMWR